MCILWFKKKKKKTENGKGKGTREKLQPFLLSLLSSSISFSFIFLTQQSSNTTTSYSLFRNYLRQRKIKIKNIMNNASLSRFIITKIKINIYPYPSSPTPILSPDSASPFIPIIILDFLILLLSLYNLTNKICIKLEYDPSSCKIHWNHHQNPENITSVILHVPSSSSVNQKLIFSFEIKIEELICLPPCLFWKSRNWNWNPEIDSCSIRLPPCSNMEIHKLKCISE